MKKLKLILLVFLLLAINFFANGQDSIRKGSWLSVDLHYGFILPLYTSSMNILVQGHVPAFEVDYISKPACTDNWLSDYHCPETGIAFFSAYLNNPAQLGNEYGIYPFVNFHLKKSFHEGLYFRIGMGLAYMPITFSRLDNHKNDRTRLEAGLGLTHCSNGAFQTPNLGINLITANTGITYSISSPTKCMKHTYPDTVKTKKIESEFIVAAGASEIEPPGGSRYPDVTFSYLAYRKLSRKGKLGLGADIFYNEANIARLKADTVILKSNLQDVQLGLKATYEITLGNLSLPIELGGYLYTKYTGNGYIYNRIGLRYYTHKHFIANLTLLTHFVKADFIEWGIGYKL